MNELLFQTNLTSVRRIPKLNASLRSLGLFSWSLDLTDAQHLLRVTARHVAPARIVAALRKAGIACELLPR